MANGCKTEMTFGEKTELALKRSHNSNRWLIKQLKEFDIKLTDAQLSNRIHGVRGWKEKEHKAIGKIFKKNKIEF